MFCKLLIHIFFLCQFFCIISGIQWVLQYSLCECSAENPTSLHHLQFLYHTSLLDSPKSIIFSSGQSVLLALQNTFLNPSTSLLRLQILDVCSMPPSFKFPMALLLFIGFQLILEFLQMRLLMLLLNQP